jgi:hypothetical protein
MNTFLSILFCFFSFVFFFPILVLLFRLPFVYQLGTFKMADALCGPSNALHTFQKQATVDRSLQQDKLALRQLPSQVGSSVDSYEILY